MYNLCSRGTLPSDIGTMSQPTTFIHSEHSYIDGPEATSLHKVDVWLPETQDAEAKQGKWIMFVAIYFDGISSC